MIIENDGTLSQVLGGFTCVSPGIFTSTKLQSVKRRRRHHYDQEGLWRHPSWTSQRLTAVRPPPPPPPPPPTDLRRRVMLPANTPTITSADLLQRRNNKHNPHMRQQLGEVLVEVMHNASVGSRQRTGRSVMLNRQFGAIAQRTTIVTTI